ncbi:MAG: BON domain-containing protein [Paracoccaceae bacterium]
MIVWLALAVTAAALGGCAPVAAVGGAGVVAHSVVQERSTVDALRDNEAAIAIAARLAQHSGELYRDVSVDVVEGRVLLTGSVPEREDAVTAEALAWEPEAVRDVTNEITVAEDAGTRAYWRDVRISNALRLSLLRDRDVSSWNYNVTTIDGTVHLTGLARSERELSKALWHARGTDGVGRVVSHVLVIDDPRRLAPPEDATEAAKRAAG